MVNITYPVYVDGRNLDEYTQKEYVDKAKDLGVDFILLDEAPCGIYHCQTYTTPDSLCKSCTIGRQDEVTIYIHLFDHIWMNQVLLEEEYEWRCISCNKYVMTIYHPQYCLFCDKGYFKKVLDSQQMKHILHMNMSDIFQHDYWDIELIPPSVRIIDDKW